MHNHNFLAIATAPVLTEKTAQALELNKILKEKSITTFFQPIVNLQDGSVLVDWQHFSGQIFRGVIA